MENKFTPELIEKAKSAKTPEELMALAKENGAELTEESAKAYFDRLHPQTGELSDDEVKKIIPRIRVIARALPTDKSRMVRLCQELNLVVGMTGDGVNDSPALSEADAGIAISTGAAIAREIADITVSSEDLFALVTLRRLSQALMERIHGSYRFIVGFNLTLIVLGVAGVLPPTTSALLHNGSTLGISLRNMTDLLDKNKS